MAIGAAVPIRRALDDERPRIAVCVMTVAVMPMVARKARKLGYTKYREHLPCIDTFEPAIEDLPLKASALKWGGGVPSSERRNFYLNQLTNYQARRGAAAPALC